MSYVPDLPAVVLFSCNYGEHKTIKENEKGSLETACALHLSENFFSKKEKKGSFEDDSVILHCRV